MAAGNAHRRVSRRSALQSAFVGSVGLALPALYRSAVSAESKTSPMPGFGGAKRCILIFNWGGMSQLESWDPKPQAPKEVRGDYKPIATAIPGVQIGEYLPKLSKQTKRLAIVRSVRHRARDHRQALFWSLTGIPPVVLDGQMVSRPVLATREDKPMIGSMVAWSRGVARGVPPTVTLPYQVAERGIVAGQNAGFLGVRFDPLVVRPKTGTPFPGVSPVSETPHLAVDGSTDYRQRQRLLAEFERSFDAGRVADNLTAYRHFRELGMDLLLNPEVRKAFAIASEPAKVQEAYGKHLFGRSLLLARRLIETDIPLVTVNSGAGDLNGGFGAIWDTHFRNFPQLKTHLMPPFDHGVTALLDDLDERGMLGETLVVLMTEFGRGAVLNQFAGRDHWPDCYAVAFAGGGVRGGQVLGRSDKLAQKVEDSACGPADLHATIFHALGIDRHRTVENASGDDIALSDGRPLALFG